MNKHLRTAFVASLRASAEAEAFAREVEDQGRQLQRIARRIHNTIARGEKPGSHTVAMVNAVTRRLGQAGMQYRGRM